MAFCSRVLSKTLLKSSQIEKISIILLLGNIAVFLLIFFALQIYKNYRYFPNFQLIKFRRTHVKINRNFMVTYFDACEILEMLSEASVKVFLDGGWGVDALIGRETRIHNDIDLFVEKKDYGKAISVITWKGYREVVMDYTTDSHTVWKDDNGRIIDLHCFEYVEDGILYDGYTFPSETFSGKGNIGNIEVTCINPEAQVQFHLGYEYDENDVHDVLLLCRTFNLEIPEQYKTHI